MSAAVLRAAAALMQSRAEAATAAPWSQEGVPYAPSRNVRAQHQDGWPLQGVAYGVSRIDDAAHIASWHPAVALAVADMLDNLAVAARFDAGSPLNGAVEDALTVARAYLGTTQ